MARHTKLSGLTASLPASSRCFGSVYGNSARQGIARAAARSASRTASSTDSRSTPGMESTGTRVFTPSTRNRGQIRSCVLSSCSRTRRRAHSALRLRRGRLARSRPGLRLISGSTGVRRASMARPYLMAIALLPDEKRPFLAAPPSPCQRCRTGAGCHNGCSPPLAPSCSG